MASRFSILRQRGIALPIMLIMLAVMMTSSVYLLRSSNSTTLTTSNLAYDSALSRAADLGIFTGLAWLNSLQAPGSHDILIADIPGQGYVSTTNMGVGQGVSNPAFWNGSRTLVDGANNKIEYVIHRLCTLPGPFDAPAPKNNCAMTASKIKAKKRIGSSEKVGGPNYAGTLQLHYVITSRISGPRGGNVMNQAIVMMGP